MKKFCLFQLNVTHCKTILARKLGKKQKSFRECTEGHKGRHVFLQLDIFSTKAQFYKLLYSNLQSLLTFYKVSSFNLRYKCNSKLV